MAEWNKARNETNWPSNSTNANEKSGIALCISVRIKFIFKLLTPKYDNTPDCLYIYTIRFYATHMEKYYTHGHICELLCDHIYEWYTLTFSEFIADSLFTEYANNQNVIIRSPRYTGVVICFCIGSYAAAGAAAARAAGAADAGSRLLSAR